MPVWLKSLQNFVSKAHGLINYKDTKTKCCLYRCSIEFIDWRYSKSSQSCWYFLHSFVNYCPSHLLSGSTPPPLPPSQSQSTVYTDSVRLGGGGGVELCWRPYSAKPFQALETKGFGFRKTIIYKNFMLEFLSRDLVSGK
jgi:hypothetical protein